jgi:hypothetical protein
MGVIFPLVALHVTLQHASVSSWRLRIHCFRQAALRASLDTIRGAGSIGVALIKEKDEMKNIARVLVLAVASCLLLSVGASSAFAAEVPAKFSSETAIKATGTGLTVKKNGGEAKTCEIVKTTTGSVANSTGGSQGVITLQNDGVFYRTNLSCSGGTTLQLILAVGSAKYETTTGAYFIRFAPFAGSSVSSPYGSYSWAAGSSDVKIGWTNGSGATASTLTFSETVLGIHTDGKSKISLTGSIKVTTSAGGLVTLSH